MDAGGGLFGEALDAPEQFGELVVHHGGEIATVIQNQVERLAIREEQGLLNAPVELFVGHALPGIDRNASLGDRCCSVVLRREDVATAPGDLCTEFDERLDQDGRLNGHVQAASNASPGERLGFAVLLPEGHQARHFILGQLDFLPAPVGQGHVGNFIWETGINVGHGILLVRELESLIGGSLPPNASYDQTF